MAVRVLEQSERGPHIERRDLSKALLTSGIGFGELAEKRKARPNGRAFKGCGPEQGDFSLVRARLLAAGVNCRSSASGALVGRAGLIRPVAFLCRVALILGQAANVMVARGNDRVDRAGCARAGAVLGHVADAVCFPTDCRW